MEAVDAPVGVGLAELPGASVGVGDEPGASDAEVTGFGPLLPVVAPPPPQPAKIVAAANAPSATYEKDFKRSDL